MKFKNTFITLFIFRGRQVKDSVIYGFTSQMTKRSSIRQKMGSWISPVLSREWWDPTAGVITASPTVCLGKGAFRSFGLKPHPGTVIQDTGFWAAMPDVCFYAET